MTAGVLLAVGWATVELDRAATGLAPLLVPGTTFVDAAPSAHLGAWCRIGRVRPGAAVAAGAPGPPGAVGADIVILLEPSTEGRLAATLARHDEGWLVTWESAGAAPDPATTSPADLRLSTERPGPLGPERLVLGGPPTGPHRLLVRPATLRP